MPRIFLLEDEPLIAMMLQGWLEEMDCETIGPTHSVQSALDLLQGASLDGALLDVSLQDDKKCYPVASVLRDRRVPFAFLTGYAAEDIDVRFREAPVLCKPLEFEAFQGHYRQASFTASIIRPPREQPETGFHRTLRLA